ncbi:MAG: hypothetical protein U5L45_03770 [Saprospiraceae bacterium]|nr:hypothetical protein [Saprospiraceae bacterium]
MVHFSGFARKMNHLSSFYASEASAKMPFNAYFEFMYGFKINKSVFLNVLLFASRKKKLSGRACIFGLKIEDF